MIIMLTWGESKRKEYPAVDLKVSCLHLDNPPSMLWTLDGRDAELRQCIVNQLLTNRKRNEWFSRLETAILRYAAIHEHFSLGFFCSGGRHRSVSVAELMRSILHRSGYQTQITHLELK